MRKQLPKVTPLMFDGGMGSLLMKNGMTSGMRSDEMNQLHPEVVEAIHRSYVEAGSEILCTNTFSVCSILSRLSDAELENAVGDAVAIAKRAAGGKALVGLDLGPTGEFMEPYGDLTYEEAYARFSRLVTCGAKAGADLVCIETMSDKEEVRAALQAAVDHTELGILVTMTFRDNGKTFTGCSVEEFAELVNAYPVEAAGLNCSQQPEDMLPAVKRLAAVLKKPLIIKLNAGLPDEHGVYSVTPEAYVRQLEAYRELPVKVLGGCCGTTPNHIAAVKKAFQG
ncbi:MAG: homocysteine S-methyltransferase family protein [Oscillospiraceae bacterium]|nr:homocysteine S-methyltransferase family protein [Oscillospiraceae bacterium]